METTTRATKDELTTAACEAIDYHAARAAELTRQRNALATLLTIVAAWLLF